MKTIKGHFSCNYPRTRSSVEGTSDAGKDVSHAGDDVVELQLLSLLLLLLLLRNGRGELVICLLHQLQSRLFKAIQKVPRLIV